jgi:hypothetical protein
MIKRRDVNQPGKREWANLRWLDPQCVDDRRYLEEQRMRFQGCFPKVKICSADAMISFLVEARTLPPINAAVPSDSNAAATVTDRKRPQPKSTTNTTNGVEPKKSTDSSFALDNAALISPVSPKEVLLSRWFSLSDELPFAPACRAQPSLPGMPGVEVFSLHPPAQQPPLLPPLHASAIRPPSASDATWPHRVAASYPSPTDASCRSTAASCPAPSLAPWGLLIPDRRPPPPAAAAQGGARGAGPLPPLLSFLSSVYSRAPPLPSPLPGASAGRIILPPPPLAWGRGAWPTGGAADCGWVGRGAEARGGADLGASVGGAIPLGFEGAKMM